MVFVVVIVVVVVVVVVVFELAQLGVSADLNICMTVTIVTTLSDEIM